MEQSLRTSHILTSLSLQRPRRVTIMVTRRLSSRYNSIDRFKSFGLHAIVLEVLLVQPEQSVGSHLIALVALGS